MLERILFAVAGLARLAGPESMEKLAEAKIPMIQ